MSNLVDGWVECSLGDVCEIKYGKDHKKLENGEIPCYGSGGFMRNVEKFIYDKPSVLIPRKGTISNLFFVEVPFWTVDTLFYTKIDENKILSKFLFYKLKNEKLENLNVGSAVPSLTTSVLNEFQLNLPPLPEQKAIADILSSFDEKIEFLREQNETLESIAQTIFKEWFVNFNFPDSTGEMVDSELGKIPVGWRIGKLGEVINLFDSQRIPLASNEREKIKGNYPYYGATKIMDYINDYIFDGTYLLLAEDGSVIDDNGFPYLQYVWGKFWVNNHTHVIQGKNNFSVESLYVFLKKRKIAGIVNGAV